MGTNMKKLIISVLGLLTVLFGVLTASCSRGETDGNGFGYVRLSDGGYGVYAVEKMSGDVVIPSEYKGATVTRIEEVFFRDGTASGEIRVTVPEGVKCVNDNAFADCVQLISVTLPSTLTEIGDKAFYNCSLLSNIAFPNGGGVETVGIEAFYYTAITTFPLSHTVKSIGFGAFNRCLRLKSIDISGVTGEMLGNEAFNGCYALGSVTLGEGLECIGKSTFASCGALKSIVIPDSVTVIDDRAFRYCSSLRWVEISPDAKLEVIVNGAFGSCAILTFTLPMDLRNNYLGNDYFSDCLDLKEVINYSDCDVKLSEGVWEKSGEYAQSDFKLDGDGFITYMNGNVCELVGYIGHAETIVVPDGVQRIKRGAFLGSQGTADIVIPDSVTEIEPSAFGAVVTLTDITVSEGNTEFSSIDGVLYSKDGTVLIAYPAGRMETEFTVPEFVTAIGDHAFYGSLVMKVIMHEGVTSVSEKAFLQALFLENNGK